MGAGAQIQTWETALGTVAAAAWQTFAALDVAVVVAFEIAFVVGAAILVASAILAAVAVLAELVAAAVAAAEFEFEFALVQPVALEFEALLAYRAGNL